MSEEPVRFFNLIVSGLGYANRARDVTTAEGYACLHVDINAMAGRQSKVQYRRFQTAVVTEEAQGIIRKFEEEINDKDSTVLVGFTISDANPASYQTETGDRRHFCYGRLLKIKWVRVNNVQVYKADVEKAENGQETYEDDVPF